MNQKTIAEIIRYLNLAYQAIVFLTLTWLLIRQLRRLSSWRLAKKAPLILFFSFFGTFLIQSGWYWYYLSELKYAAAYLPPHSQFFLRQAQAGLTNYLAGLAGAAGLLGAGWYVFIRRLRGEFLDGDDLMLLVIGALAVGWPAVLVFLAVTFALSVFGLLGLIVIRRKTIHDRLIITPYIIPAAILTLIFRVPLLEFTHLIKIRF